MQALEHYFPGGNTPEGFYSFYGEIADCRHPNKLAVIKGGPGTGKSTFLKKLGTTLADSGKKVTYLHCSSDPDSLDGIYLPDCNSAVIDGTAPHITDVRYPGAYDMVLNFCDFIGPVSDCEDLIAESVGAKRAFSEGYCYLRSAKSLLDLMHSRSEQCLIQDEVRSFSLEIAKRISSFPADGTRKNVFLSAITADGFRNFIKENLKDYYVIALNTEAADASYRVMQAVVTACGLRNADMIVCACPMNPSKAEHLVFPSANLALVTSNEYHPCFNADEMIPFSDFVSCKTSDSKLQILYDTLLHRAIDTFFKAREHHNRLEAIYQTVTDYSKIDSFDNKTFHFLTS